MSRSHPSRANRARAHVVLAATFIVALLATPAAAQQIRRDGVADAELRALVALAAEGDERWNARDAAGLSRTFTEDGHNLIVGTQVDLRGRQAIREFFDGSLRRVEPALRHRTILAELQHVTPDLIAVDGRVWLERMGEGGACTPVRSFRMSALAMRTADEWRIRLNRVWVEPVAEGAACVTSEE